MRPILPVLLGLALAACGRGQAARDATASRADSAAAAETESAQAAAPGQAAGRIAFAMVRDSGTGAVLPRLTDSAGAQARAVNRFLDSMSATMRCDTAFAPNGDPTEFEAEARVTYAADSIFSVHIRESYYCGGPYPTNGANFSATFDMRTGVEVPFEALFADWARDGAAIVRVIYPEQVAGADRIAAAGEPDPDDEDCNQFYAPDRLAEGGFHYAFSDAGLMVEADFPHVIAACGGEAVVPYERLRPFAAPGGILARRATAKR
jgi:hypothetical protein